jgi:Ca-activated chloride channel family protein
MVKRLDGTWRTRARWLLPVLRTAILVLLIVAVARPRKGNEQERIRSEGIAIQLLVDRSGSMQAMDFTLDGKRANRLAAIQKVVRDFVLGDGELRGRTDDLIGMIAFARYADGKCPLTLDHGFLIESLNKTEIETRREYDGTAIGDAVALGVEHLRAVDEQRRVRGGNKIKSKVIILLTDGQNNAGDIDPFKAAQLATTLGVKIYTIGVGTRGIAQMPVIDPFTGATVFQPVQVNIDEDTLRKIAEATSGQYFRATDTDTLRGIYVDIDKMEKQETEEKRFYQYRELATEWVRLGRVSLPPLLVCVFALLIVEMVLAHTWLRRVP